MKRPCPGSARSLQTVVAVAVLGSSLCFATGVDFTWTPTNPVAGQPVSFFDTSTATPTSWSWNFGDGGTSSQQDPVHTYSGPGTFTVTLSIGSPFGSIFRSKPITVTASGAPPSARFSWSPADPVEGVAVRFSDTSTGSPTSWSWQFDDGGTSNARSPEHTYTIPRTYMVSLTVSNASGTDTVSRNLTVQSATYVPPVVDAGEFVYTIPASAHAPGEANTSWVTDVVLHNAGSSPANAYVYFLQRLQDNTGAIGRPVAVPPGRSVQIDDAVASLFGHSSATGALRVGSDRAVVVSSRTYNDASDGTFGQYIPGGPNWRTVRAGETVYLIQLTNNQDFRTNIGFANVAVTAVTITVQIFSANGGSLASTSYTIPPLGFYQAGGLIPGAVDDAYAVVSSQTEGARYYTYASVVDNRSGDPVYILPAASVFESSLYIPAAAHATGVGGTIWRTDVEVCNPSTSTVQYSLAYLPAGEDNSAPATGIFVLAAGMCFRHGDVVGTTFGAQGVGALRVEALIGEVAATSRTYNDAASGTFGQFIAGVPESAAMIPGEARHLVQLSRSASSSRGFRTNVGLASATTEAMAVEVLTYGSDGGLLGSETLELLPFGWAQINDIFGRYSSGDVEIGSATVATYTPEGRFFAYASVVDNRSGDPVFVPASEPGATAERLSFTLLWEQQADLDLLVADPSGEVVYWNHPITVSGGVHARDCICDCQVESTAWEEGLALDGTYTFWADFHFQNLCETTVSVDLELQVHKGDELVEVHRATLNAAGEQTELFTYQFEATGGPPP